MEGGGPGGGNDVELVCKTLQFEHELFYFDLKENPRGRYLKFSEKTSATRSTIIVPVDGIVWFRDLFEYYIVGCSADDGAAVSFIKELKLETKVSYFDVGQNKRGRFLKVSEASVSRNRSTIIVPSGSSGEERCNIWNLRTDFQDFQMMWELDLYRTIVRCHLPDQNWM